MNQNIWGPHMWFVLHTITFNYPINPKEDIIKYHSDFLYSLQYVLPCGVCRKHYKRHIKENPPEKALENRDNFIKWMIDLHNEVNGETGKKNTYTYQEIISRYEKVYNMKIINNISTQEIKSKNLNHYYQIIVIILIMFIFIYYFFKIKK